MLVSSKFGSSWTLTITVVTWVHCRKLTLGYCVVLCLPPIHFEPEASIATRRIHHDRHWWLSLEVMGKGQFGAKMGAHCHTIISDHMTSACQHSIFHVAYGSTTSFNYLYDV